MSALFDEVAAILVLAGIDDAAAETSRIVQAALVSTPAAPAAAARAMAARRAAGVPLAYVTGHEMFMGVELIVAEGALVPREETQLLGNTALDALRFSGSAAPRAIDMCCGSGNLACAIAHHLPGVRVWASDLTDGCIAVTRRNVEHVGVSDRVVVAQGDLFAGFAGFGLEGSIDAVICNPPYISQGKLASERAELLEHEPREAFDGGPYDSASSSALSRKRCRFCGPVASSSSRSALGRNARSGCYSSARRLTRTY